MGNNVIKNETTQACEIEEFIVKIFHNLDNNPRKDYLMLEDLCGITNTKYVSLDFVKFLVKKSGYKENDKLYLDMFIYIITNETTSNDYDLIKSLYHILELSKLPPKFLPVNEDNLLVITSWKSKPRSWNGSDVHIYPMMLETQIGGITNCGITTYSPRGELHKQKKESMYYRGERKVESTISSDFKRSESIVREIYGSHEPYYFKSEIKDGQKSENPKREHKKNLTNYNITDSSKNRKVRKVKSDTSTFEEFKQNLFKRANTNPNIRTRKDLSDKIEIIAMSWTEKLRFEFKNEQNEKKTHYSFYNFPFACNNINRIDDQIIKESENTENTEKYKKYGLQYEWIPPDGITIYKSNNLKLASISTTNDCNGIQCVYLL
jgi:hypothetical protein